MNRPIKPYDDPAANWTWIDGMLALAALAMLGFGSWIMYSLNQLP